MKKLFLFIVAAIFAAVSFSACSDDDKGDNNAPSKIVGTWELVHIYYEEDDFEYGHDEDDYDVAQGDEEWHILVFNEDGTFAEKYGDNDSDAGNYSIEGNKIMMEYVFDEGDWEIVTIKTLNSKTLVLEIVEQDEYGHYKGVFTYKRI